ncbi:hypothetical protein GCM10023149_31620 [Mucilaginibacter gynuensis]|uniref:Uncharacterized protein n=1 Tax=Mucilaginibacter gynuensis TaxID=1302236 RepID=A0ABP8GP53_9SPHI
MAENDLDRISENQHPRPDYRANLENRALYKKHIREARRFGAINWCFIIFVWVCLISVGGIIVIKILHVLLPQQYCWLKKEQLDNINDFFVDGSIGGLVVGFLKSSIMDKKEE